MKKTKKQVDCKKLPYFETKVVKVKKKKKDNWVGGLDIENKSYKIIRDKKGNHYLKEFDKPKQSNWSNGENLDKIKFPCFCSWNIPLNHDIQYGIMSVNKDDTYELFKITEQHSYSPHVSSDISLKELIKRWNIHILKGKIIIFEEE